MSKYDLESIPLPSPKPRPGANDDFAVLEDRGVMRQSALTAAAGAGVPGPASGGHESERLAGTLVHRLLQRFGLADLDDAPAAEAAAALLRHGETTADGDPDVARRAAAAYRLFCARRDVREWYAAGEAIHEVPFTMSVAGSVVRGTIDCIVRGPEGRVIVLEFKTGRHRPEHTAQIELYRKAAEAVFPGAPVDVKLVYAEEAATA